MEKQRYNGLGEVIYGVKTAIRSRDDNDRKKLLSFFIKDAKELAITIKNELRGLR